MSLPCVCNYWFILFFIILFMQLWGQDGQLLAQRKVLDGKVSVQCENETQEWQNHSFHSAWEPNCESGNSKIKAKRTTRWARGTFRAILYVIIQQVKCPKTLLSELSSCLRQIESPILSICDYWEQGGVVPIIVTELALHSIAWMLSTDQDDTDFGIQ